MAMAAYEGATRYLPESRSLDRLRSAVTSCHGCDLYRDATQAVFGDGAVPARIAFVGEQPGNQEDLAGEPFVGPAGGLLDKALGEAGIGRDEVYLTNAVKHFRFVPAERGKRRVHKKPSRGQIAACLPWLHAELGALRPELVVFLGATAAQAMLGSSFRVSKRRGELVELPDSPLAELDPLPKAMATVHPSSVLRAPPEQRDDAYAGLVADLRAAAAAL